MGISTLKHVAPALTADWAPQHTSTSHITTTRPHLQAVLLGGAHRSLVHLHHRPHRLPVRLPGRRLGHCCQRGPCSRQDLGCRLRTQLPSLVPNRGQMAHRGRQQAQAVCQAAASGGVGCAAAAARLLRCLDKGRC